MSSFSYRRGLKKVRDTLQLDYIDDELRNGLWNVLITLYFDIMEQFWISDDKEMNTFIRRLYLHHFKMPLDTIDNRWRTTYQTIRNHFFSCNYGEVYDFLEFINKQYPDEDISDTFKQTCNLILERENSAYRFVGEKITEIISKEEIEEIEEALDTPVIPVKIHIEQALDHMSDRENPDFRNSIKESISAVEAISTKIVGTKMRTFQLALSELGKKIDFDDTLNQGFGKIYGWSSDKKGIRHALLERPDLYYEDAKFMLVSCSAFVNYLLAKATRAGIKLE